MDALPPFGPVALPLGRHELDAALDAEVQVVSPLGEHELRQMLDNLPAMLAYFDSPSVVCRFANQAYAHANGREAHWCRGRHCRDIVGAPAWAQILPYVTQVMNGRAVLYERELTVVGLASRHVEVNLLPHRTADGRQIGVWVMITDITRRADAERSALAAQERVESFARATSEGIGFYKDSLLIDCNDALSRILGQPIEALIGQDVVGFFKPIDRGVATRHIHLGRDTPYPVTLKRADGSTIDVEILGKTATLHGAQVSVASVRDVSQFNQVSASLMRSQARYRALVENTTEGVLFIQDRTVVYGNPGAERIFNMAPGQMVGERWLDRIHPDDRESILRKRHEFAVGAPDRSAEVRVMVEGGEAHKPDVRWVRVFGTQIDWEDRAATLLFLSDVTLERESQQQLEKSLQRERELGELKTRFVSMASHEFRTPLATIQTSSELLQHYSDRLTADQREEVIVDIQKAVARMQAMMDNFLSFGRMGAFAVGCDPQPVRLGPLLSAIATEIAAADGNRHPIALTLDDACRNATLLLDEVLVRQFVGNLLSNACKYSAAASPVSVQAACARVADAFELVLRVEDGGIGVPPQDLPRLFETFHRAANVGAVSGTGLGLAIVKRAVVAHGGTVEVSSTLGRGSCFTVRLAWVAKTA